MAGLGMMPSVSAVPSTFAAMPMMPALMPGGVSTGGVSKAASMAPPTSMMYQNPSMAAVAAAMQQQQQQAMQPMQSMQPMPSMQSMQQQQQQQQQQQPDHQQLMMMAAYMRAMTGMPMP